MNRAASILATCLLCACSDDNSTDQAGKSGVDSRPMSAIDSGYRSGIDDWVAFLDCWDARAAELAVEHDVPYEPVWPKAKADAASKLGETEARLRAVEERLGLRFPTSYRHFLQAGGGSFVSAFNHRNLESDPSYSSFVKAEKLQPFSVAQDWYWKELQQYPDRPVPADRYYRYGFAFDPERWQDSYSYSIEPLREAIFVGEIFQGFLVLNPHEITRDREWEAWSMDDEGGVVRFRSFAEMMQHHFVEDAGSPMARGHQPPHKLRQSCARLLKTVALEDTLGPEERWTALYRRVEKASDSYSLQAALRHLCALDDDPRLVPTLMRFSAHEDREVAKWVVFALGQLRARVAIPMLLEQARDEERANAATAALREMVRPEDTWLIPHFMRLLEHDDLLVRIGAAESLAAIRSKESVPALIKALSDEAPRVIEHAVIALGRIGDPRAAISLTELRGRIGSMALSAPGVGGGRATAPSAERLEAAIDVALRRCQKRSQPAAGDPGR